MTRYRAAAYYLLASGIVATAIFLPIHFLWYPWALFDKAGGRELFQLIVGVDLVVGPLLVSVIFVPGKKGLAFDLSFIAALQSAALAFGIFVLFESRPVYIVFVKDRFELVRANDIPEQELDRPESGPYARLPWLGPRIIGARIPKDPDEQFRMMMSALGGLDIQSFPKYYVPYGEVRAQVIARAEALSRLRELNGQRLAEIDRLVAKLRRAEGELRFLPMRAGRHADLTVVVDAASGDLLDVVALRPWEYE